MNFISSIIIHLTKFRGSIQFVRMSNSTGQVLLTKGNSNELTASEVSKSLQRSMIAAVNLGAGFKQGVDTVITRLGITELAKRLTIACEIANKPQPLQAGGHKSKKSQTSKGAKEPNEVGELMEEMKKVQADFINDVNDNFVTYAKNQIKACESVSGIYKAYEELVGKLINAKGSGSILQGSKMDLFSKASHALLEVIKEKSSCHEGDVQRYNDSIREIDTCLSCIANMFAKVYNSTPEAGSNELEGGSGNITESCFYMKRDPVARNVLISVSKIVSDLDTKFVESFARFGSQPPEKWGNFLIGIRSITIPGKYRGGPTAKSFHSTLDAVLGEAHWKDESGQDWYPNNTEKLQIAAKRIELALAIKCTDDIKRKAEEFIENGIKTFGDLRVCVGMVGPHGALQPQSEIEQAAERLKDDDPEKAKGLERNENLTRLRGKLIETILTMDEAQATEIILRHATNLTIELNNAIRDKKTPQEIYAAWKNVGHSICEMYWTQQAINMLFQNNTLDTQQGVNVSQQDVNVLANFSTAFKKAILTLEDTYKQGEVRRTDSVNMGVDNVYKAVRKAELEECLRGMEIYIKDSMHKVIEEIRSQILKENGNEKGGKYLTNNKYKKERVERFADAFASAIKDGSAKIEIGKGNSRVELSQIKIVVPSNNELRNALVDKFQMGNPLSIVGNEREANIALILDIFRNHPEWIEVTDTIFGSANGNKSNNEGNLKGSYCLHNKKH
jgi:hypothetical protein